MRPCPSDLQLIKCSFNVRTAYDVGTQAVAGINAAGDVPTAASSGSVVRAAGKGPGGDCWLLLRSARVEAEELKRDITSVLDQLENLNPANRQYGEALQFEHSQLSELRKMKQVQMEKLADRLSFLDQQPVRL